VAEQHGGSVSAANVDGGAELTLHLPGSDPQTLPGAARREW
jgi:hypothetical protein